MSKPALGPDRTPPKPPPKSTLPWLIVAGIVVAIWSFGSSLSPIPPDVVEGHAGPERMAAAIGYLGGSTVSRVLIAAGVVWLVLYFGFTRRLDRRRGPNQFLILCLVAAVATAPVVVLSLVGLSQGSLASAAVPDILNSGQARIEAIMETTRAEQARITEGDPFSNAALSRPGGVRTARVRLTEMRRVTADARTQVTEVATDMRRQLAALPMSDRRRADLLAQHDRGVARAREDFRVSQDAVDEIFDAIEGKLDVLSRRPRGWVARNGDLAFTSERDLTDFNAQAEKVEAAQARIVANAP